MYKSLQYEGGEGWPVVVRNEDDLSWQCFPVPDELEDNPREAAFAIMECWLKLPEFQKDDPFDPEWRKEWVLVGFYGDEGQYMAIWTPYRGADVTFVFECG